MQTPYKAIVVKELREVWWIGALGGAIVLFFALISIGWDLDNRPPFYTRHPPRGVPFLEEDWISAIVIGGGIAAALMGLRQTLGESAQGTWLFYLFRPVRRRTLMLAKLGIGIGLLLLMVGLPILMLTIWAAMPGTHASPFEWWMLEPTLRAWAWLPVAYLAVFLCGLRPARWYVSRFLPLVPALIPGVWMFVTPWWSGTIWGLLIGTTAVYLLAILGVMQERDYA